MFHAKRLRCYGSLTCSPFNVSLPFLRVHLTTAHTQLSTVIRFSRSRFVTPQPSTPWANSSFPLPHPCPVDLFCILADGKKMETCLSSSFLFWLLIPGVGDVPYVFSPQQLFTSLWTGACTLLAIFAFLISVLFFVCIFPLPSLSFNTFLLCCLFASCVFHYFAPQMVFPSYNHGFISGDQSNSFQRRFLKVDHNKRHACSLTAHRHLPSSNISLPKPFPPTLPSYFCFHLCCYICFICLLQ